MSKYCHSMRCYMCNIFGHKDKSYENKVRNPKRIVLYVTNKENERFRIQSQRKSMHKGNLCTSSDGSRKYHTQVHLKQQVTASRLANHQKVK